MSARATQIERAAMPHSMPAARFHVEAPLEALTGRASRNTPLVEVDAAKPSPPGGLSELASLTHEIAQPVTAVASLIHATRALLADEGPRWVAERMLHEAAGEVDRLNNILAATRDLLAHRQARRRAVEPLQMVRPLVVRLEAAAKQVGATLQLQTAPSLAKVEADPVQIEQVLDNLIRNAIDAVATVPADQRRITVDVRPASGGGVRFSVEDTGPGIDAGSESAIFEPFYTTRPGGAGMGLFICRSIIEHHRGALTMDASAGRGCCFHFELPATNPHATSVAEQQVVTLPRQEEQAA